MTIPEHTFNSDAVIHKFFLYILVDLAAAAMYNKIIGENMYFLVIFSLDASPHHRAENIIEFSLNPPFIYVCTVQGWDVDNTLERMRLPA
jgi:hypothetical protein